MMGHLTTGGGLSLDELASTVTLQYAYDNSTSPEITLDATNGALTIRDNATPIGANLLEVEENDGTPIMQVGIDDGILMGKMRDTLGSPAIKIFQTPDPFNSINIWPESMTFSQAFGSGINFGDSAKTYTLNINSGTFGGINQRGTYVHMSSTSASAYAVLMSQAATYKNAVGSSQPFGPIVIARSQVTVNSDTETITAAFVGGIDMSNTLFGNVNGGALTVTEYAGVRMKNDNHLFATVDRRVGLDFDNSNLGFGTLTDNVAVDIANLNYGTNRFGIRSAMAVGKFLSHTGVAVSELAGELRLLGDNVSAVFGAGQDADIYYDATNLIIDPDVAGTGRVLIGATGDDDMLLNDIEIDGALNHDGATVGFYGTAPAAQSAAYTRNATIVEDRTLLASASATTLNNNNVLAALIADLQNIGVLA